MTNPDEVNKTENKITVDTVGYSLKPIDDLHERLTMKDYDKNLTDYINSNPNKVDSNRKVVYILPFGNMKPEVEKIIKEEVEYLKAFLQLEVKVLDRVSYDSIKKISSIQTRMVPSSDFDYYSKMKGGTPTLTEQIHASSFIEALMKNNKPKDAVAVLGITEHDIYNPKYNYLFGLSELKDGVGLVSTFRLIDYGQETKYNIRKAVSKQIVNMFSISNVKDYKCVLNFHKSIEELYQGKFDLSPRALEKLKYAIEFDYSKRFKDLEQFWKKEKNIEEEKYYKECTIRLNKASH
ncbi:archaemetzincin [Myroides sp. JBRI-B21084]|uniref:archaemetzincin n=1 Tax=Myroides sp. JBRI-B21084 TaxID=3119977 RepID=UPI0026E443DE|nr:archaemetzincin [Paenimyroides cloacae]WKW46885.1 archaemetzincin [Paenimyroides cloacae]